MSFSNRILAGLAGGVLLGVFVGERALVLEWAADGFVKLLQMTVLPYATVSIVGSLGRLATSSCPGSSPRQIAPAARCSEARPVHCRRQFKYGSMGMIVPSGRYFSSVTLMLRRWVRPPESWASW